MLHRTDTVQYIHILWDPLCTEHWTDGGQGSQIEDTDTKTVRDQCVGQATEHAQTEQVTSAPHSLACCRKKHIQWSRTQGMRKENANGYGLDHIWPRLQYHVNEPSHNASTGWTHRTSQYTVAPIPWTIQCLNFWIWLNTSELSTDFLLTVITNNFTICFQIAAKPILIWNACKYPIKSNRRESFAHTSVTSHITSMILF